STICNPDVHPSAFRLSTIVHPPLPRSSFFLYRRTHHRDLLSLPTRRSSDLPTPHPFPYASMSSPAPPLRPVQAPPEGAYPQEGWEGPMGGFPHEPPALPGENSSLLFLPPHKPGLLPHTLQGTNCRGWEKAVQGS